MANLPESATWENGIYQIETTDFVVGGVNGTSNVQAKQLANRTVYLKSAVEAAQADANAAQSTANTALSDAATAQATADAAQSTANTALSDAATAQATANSALSVATTDASEAQAGRVSIGSQSFSGQKTFNYSAASNNVLHNVTQFCATTSGDMVDGFGSAIVFQIRDNAGVRNSIGYMGFKRAGADDKGTFFIITNNSGLLNESFIVRPDGKVGIKNNSPGADLEINGSARVNDGDFIVNEGSWQGRWGAETYGITAGPVLGTDSNVPIVFAINQLERARLTSSGFGIGTDNPGRQLHVNNSSASAVIRISSNQNASLELSDLNLNAYWQIEKRSNNHLYFYNGEDRFIFATSGVGTAADWVATSDARKKCNIRTVDRSGIIGKVYAIANSVRAYEWKETGVSEVGFVAQILRDIAPEYVTGRESDNEYLAVNYSKMVVPLYQGMAELIERMAELEKRIK